MLSGMLAVLLLQAPLADSGQSGLVTIVATSTYGEVLSNPTIKVESLQPQGPVSITWRNGTSLPYGKYRFKVFVAGFSFGVAELDVSTPTVTICIALPLGDDGGRSDEQDVVLKVNQVDVDCRVLTLKHVYYSGPVKASSRRYFISEQGTVSVDGLISGTYFFALVRNDGSICRAGTFKMVLHKAPIPLDAPPSQALR